MDLRKKAERIIEILERTYPDAPATYLDHSNPFEMLIVTILSARVTDAGVNKVSPTLFGSYPTPEKLGHANPIEVGKIIRPLGSYNKKAEYITETSRML